MALVFHDMSRIVQYFFSMTDVALQHFLSWINL